MILSPRMALAASLCPPRCRLIDVGCDHGYLTIALLERGAQGAVATDIRPAPLARAQENVIARGLSHQVRFILGDGLMVVQPTDGDTIAVCGMGGEAIAAILEAAPWTLQGDHLLILQPMTRSRTLRRFLMEKGYRIEAERLAGEGERIYPVLSARGGGVPRQVEEEAHLVFTPLMESDPLFEDYLALQCRRWQRVVRGMEQGGQDAAKERAILKQIQGYGRGNNRAD